MKVTLPYPPSVNHSFVTVQTKTGLRMVKTQKASSYREEAQKILLVERVKPVKGEVAVTIHAYRPRNRGDIDNTIKACLDALSGFAFTDDEKVCELHVYREKDAKNPRVEVEVNERVG